MVNTMTELNDKFPMCRQNLADCLMHKNGRCLALTDTFGLREPCPFYLTEQIAAEKYPRDIVKEISKRYGKGK